MKLPKKITPCPIIDATIEIRFDAILPSEAVFGILYEKFKDDYKHFEKLPILQIPEEIRSVDPNLIFQPHYKIRRDNYVIQIGPKIVSFSCIENYSGWDVFFKDAKSIFNKVKKTGVFKKINRLGVRYINLFEESVFDKVKLEVKMEGRSLEGHGSMFRTVIKSDQFYCNLQLADNVNYQKDTTITSGSVIDIDISIENSDINLFDCLNETIESAHRSEKTLFYSLLKEDFLKTLNPVY